MAAARQSSPRIAVIGAGIAGLAAAHRIGELNPLAVVRVFEASNRAGGVLQTDHQDGWLIERSADSFITNVPAAVDLCRRIGLERELIGTNERFRRAFVVRRGKLRPVPDGFALMAPAKFWPLVFSRILSPVGKLRLAAEYLVPRRSDPTADESLESFVCRRFGRQTFERLVQPLVGGIYTGDPAKLSLQATLPRFLQMEHECGSLIRAALGQRRKARRTKNIQSADKSAGARYQLFQTLRGGMQQLVDTLVARLPPNSLRLNCAVQQVRPVREGQWQVQYAAQGRPDATASSTTENFDAVILAVPAQVAARILQPVAPRLSGLLSGIEYAGTSIVSVGYHREHIGHALDGFGFVVPAIENRKILAASFSSVKFNGRAPLDRELIRVFVGGALQPELADLPDEELRQMVHEELKQLLQISGEPIFTNITRWKNAMPQYHIGHIQRVANIEAEVQTLPGLALAGNSLYGVGIPNCIASGENAARRAIAAAELYCEQR